MIFSRRLVLFLSVCSTALMLSSCGKPSGDVAYKDVQSCRVDASAHPLPSNKTLGNPPVDECQHSYDVAYSQWQHLPGYKTQEDCQTSQGGECLRRDDGTWMSPMVGFLLGSLVANHYTSTPVTMGRSLPCGTTTNITGTRVQSCSSGSSSGHSFYAGRYRSDNLSIMDSSTPGRFRFMGLRNGHMTEVKSQTISERVSSVAHAESFHAISKTFSRGGFGRAGFAHASFGS